MKSKLEKLSYVKKVVVEGNFYHISTTTSEDIRKILAGVFIEGGLPPLTINLPKITLEEAFITLTEENISLFTGVNDAINA